MFKKRELWAHQIVVGAILAFPWPAVAQQNPAVQNRPEDFIKELQENERTQPPPQANVPTVISGPKTPPGDTSASTMRFSLKRILISKSAVLSNEKLRSLARQYEGREIVLNDINTLVKQINELYVAADFRLGLAILPPQTIKDDTLQIVLVEPRVAGVDVHNAAYTDPEYLQSQIPLAKDQLIDLKALENALTLIRRKMVSGTQVAARLVPGDAFGTTRIVLEVIEPPRHTLQTVVDNFGPRSSGVTRSQTLYNNAQFRGRDDPLILGVSFSEGSKAVFGIYDMPIGISGLRLETQFSFSHSEVIGGNFSQLGLKSDGQFAAAELRYPFVFSPNWSVYGFAGAAYSNGNTDTGPLEVTNTVGRIAAGTRVFYYDTGTVVQFENKFTGLWSRQHNNAGDDYGEYFHYTGLLAASRAIGSFTLVAEAAWQLTPNHLLPSSEQFAIGGITTLRAYELNQFNGDEGARGRLELRAPNISLSRLIDRPDDWLHVVPLVFAETGMVVPYRAVGDKHRREDYASDVGIGLNLSALSGRFYGRAMVAKSLDEIQKPLLTTNPKILLEAGIRIQF